MWIFIIMAHPYPQGDKRTPEFNRIFLNYIKDKPFYIIDRRTGKPVPNMPDLVGDSLSGLYYVGDLMGGNFIFDANARVIIRYEMIRNGHIIHKDAQYWIETAIDNFESGVWVLREWYHNGLTYSDVVKNLNTVQDFNPFSELNESEEWFESEEDYTKYFVVGQKFRFNSRSGDAGTFYGQIVKVNRDYVWITPPSLAKMSRGTRFSKERILGLLVNGDWTPVKTPIKESTELRKVIEPGMSIYCHTDVHGYKAGKWYTIYDVDYNAGSNGEDLIKISNPEDEYATEANWTIQKDENDLNYENWFTFGDTEFDTNKAFDSLYESEEGNDLEWAEESVKGIEAPNSVPYAVKVRTGMRVCLPGHSYANYDKPWHTIQIGGINPNREYNVKRVDVLDGLLCYVYSFHGYDEMYTPIEDFKPEDIINSFFEEYSLDDLGFDKGGEEFGNEIPYSYLRVGDEIMFTTHPQWRGCGFPDEYERGKILKTNGTKFLVKTNEITYCTARLENWASNSSTMLEGLQRMCKDNLNDRYHYCIEIDRRTQSKYYMVYKREELNESVGDELAWAQELYDNADEIVTSKNAFKGAKVIRGKDWDFGNQDEGSVYGIIQQGSKISRDDFTIIENDNGLRMEDYTQNGPDDYYQIWVNVNWVNEDGQITDSNTYRVGPDKFDLKFFID